MRVVFAVESGTDVRLLEGLAERWDLQVLARKIPEGREINHPPTVPVDVRLGPARRAAFGLWLGRMLSGPARRAEHVLVQGYGPAAAAANAVGRTLGRPVTMLVCSPIERYYRTRGRDGPRPFRARELRAIRALAALNARIGQRYVVLSRHLADVVRSHGTRRPIHLVPVYGVDLRRFRPPEAPRDALRTRLGLPVERTVVLFASRIAPEKDAATLLKAVAQLVRAGRDLHLLHLSGGHAAFAAAAGRHGLADRVTARDAVHPTDELPAYLQSVDLCVQASREEGLGFAPLEALACHVPVVASAVGGLRETIVPGETGWTYPVGDVDALGTAMAAALDDPAEAARRAAAGRTMVERRYARDRVFADLAKVLEASR